MWLSLVFSKETFVDICSKHLGFEIFFWRLERFVGVSDINLGIFVL